MRVVRMMGLPALAIALVLCTTLSGVQGQPTYYDRPPVVTVKALQTESAKYCNQIVQTSGGVTQLAQDRYLLTETDRIHNETHVLTIRNKAELGLPEVGQVLDVIGRLHCLEAGAQLEEFERTGPEGAEEPGKEFNWVLWGAVGVFGAVLVVFLIVLLRPQRSQEEVIVVPSGEGTGHANGDKPGVPAGAAAASDATVDFEGSWKVVSGGVDGDPQSGVLTGKVESADGMTIGRESDNDIVLRAATVSRHAARIYRTKDGTLQIAQHPRGNPLKLTLPDGTNQELKEGQTAALVGGIRVRVGSVELEFEV